MNCYLDLTPTIHVLMLTLHTHDITMFGGMNGKLPSKILSGNESRVRKEKIMKWVFQTLAKDRD